MRATTSRRATLPGLRGVRRDPRSGRALPKLPGSGHAGRPRPARDAPMTTTAIHVALAVLAWPIPAVPHDRRDPPHPTVCGPGTGADPKATDAGNRPGHGCVARRAAARTCTGAVTRPNRIHDQPHRRWAQSLQPDHPSAPTCRVTVQHQVVPPYPKPEEGSLIMSTANPGSRHGTRLPRQPAGRGDQHERDTWTRHWRVHSQAANVGPRWSLGRGKPVVPSRWQATARPARFPWAALPSKPGWYRQGFRPCSTCSVCPCWRVDVVAAGATGLAMSVP